MYTCKDNFQRIFKASEQKLFLIQAFMSLFYTINIAKRLVPKINQWGLSIYMYIKIVIIYPLLGSHLHSIHIEQAKSNLLVKYPHNTPQIKFKWGHNVPLWSRIRLYLIVNCIKLLVIRFKCPHITRLWYRMFIFILLVVWYVGLQVSLCLSISDTFSWSDIVASWLYT